jgi:hypothetical protein
VYFSFFLFLVTLLLVTFRVASAYSASVFIQFTERQLTVNMHSLHQYDFGRMNSGVFICWPVHCQMAALTLNFARISHTERTIRSSLIRCKVCEDKAAPDRKYSDKAQWSVFV